MIVDDDETMIPLQHTTGALSLGRFAFVLSFFSFFLSFLPLLRISLSCIAYQHEYGSVGGIPSLHMPAHDGID